MKENPHSNVIQVYEFREVSEPMIIMVNCPDKSIADADIVDDEKYISAFGQILDGLRLLHIKEVTHCDLKLENFLVERKSK